MCCARAFLLFLGSAVAMLYVSNWCVCKSSSVEVIKK